jgi:hypothetical protein
MKRSKLIEILQDKFKDTILYPKLIGDANKSIYFKNKKTDRTVDFKCYSYNDRLSLEHDSCIWYFFIYEGTDDYQEYRIPEEYTDIYIEMIRDNYLEYLNKKCELDSSLKQLRELRSSDIESKIRDYKLSKVLNND